MISLPEGLNNTEAIISYNFLTGNLLYISKLTTYWYDQVST